VGVPHLWPHVHAATTVELHPVGDVHHLVRPHGKAVHGRGVVAAGVTGLGPVLGATEMLRLLLACRGGAGGKPRRRPRVENVTGVLLPFVGHVHGVWVRCRTPLVRHVHWATR
jgi:hypothetical protein